MKKSIEIILKLFVVIAIIVITVCVTLMIVNNSSKKDKSSNITATSTPTSDNWSIDDVLNMFEQKGIKIELEDKPYYSLIDAKDGAMFYLGDDVVKLYEYPTEKAYNKALEEYDLIKDMPKKGLVILDTSSTTAIDIFNSL